jgi:acyl dehydratase
VIDPEFVRGFKTEGRQMIVPRDVILYALGVGATADDSDRHYVYEKVLQPIPTMAAVVAREPFWLNDPRTGIDVRKLLHGEQTLIVHRPIPVSGELHSRLTVAGLYDKGPGRGAILDMRRELYDAGGHHLATVGIRSMLRGDGGFGGQSDGLPAPHPTPSGPPDEIVRLPTLTQQALIYRLSGDYNPIHVDPAVGRAAGFAGPILHGLCTYGVAARALLKVVGDNEPMRLKRLDARFSNPAYPGETIVTEIWKETGGQVAFCCKSAERGIVIIQNGLACFS